MGLISVQGSSLQTSSPTATKTLRTGVTDKRPALNNQTIFDESVVKKSFLNNSSINQDSFKNEMSAIAGYPEGAPIYVTYYSQNIALGDFRAHNVELATADKDKVHFSWTEIRNFELRLSSEIDFNFDADTNVSEVGGQALVLAGFEPKVNDNFLYEMRNNKIGVFTITAIQRMALGQDTYHQISFTMQSYLTFEMKELFRVQTTAVFYFDKSKFLTGNHAFLTSADYLSQEGLEGIRREIVQNYGDRFYRKDMRSFMRPDNIYDPYIVEFWNRRIDYRECGFRPQQLLVNVQNYKKSIWAALTSNPIKDLRNYKQDITKGHSYATFWTLSITPLLDMAYLKVGDETGGDVYSTYRDPGSYIPMSSLPIYQPDLPYSIRQKNFKENKHRLWHEAYADVPPHPDCPLGYTACKDVFDFHGCENCKLISQCKRWFWCNEANDDDCDCGKFHNKHCKEPKNYYALSPAFYNGDASMPPYERLIYDCVTGADVAPEKILDAVSSYMEWSDEDAFYQELFAIFLIGRAQYYLKFHR